MRTPLLLRLLLLTVGLGVPLAFAGLDLDGDGYDTGRDCDDNNAAVSPAACELVDDALDGDCDGTELCYDDSDLDGRRDGYHTVVSADLSCDGLGEATATSDFDHCYDTRFQDTDSDGVCDDDDLCYGDNTTDDTDGDGICDDQDRCLGDDSLDDHDVDGVCDDRDLCEGRDSDGDADSDGVCDDLDPCPDDPLDDADGDGVCVPDDICPSLWSPGSMVGFSDAVTLFEDLRTGIAWVRAGDLDSDGAVDLVTAVELGLWWWTPGSSVPSAPIDAGFGRASALEVADLDGDGDLDVLATSDDRRELVWYRNLGAALFEPGVVLAEPSGTMALAAADLNGDAALDVIVATLDGVVWLRAQGDGHFDSAELITAVPNRAVQAVDLDLDGDVDLLVVSASGSSVSWLQNGGTGRFFPSETIETGAEVGGAAAADLDRDQALDVVVTARFDELVRWRPQQARGFGVRQTIHDGTPAVGLTTGDLDADGDVDLATIDLENALLSWYENDGAGRFTRYVVSERMDGVSVVQIVDLDADDRPDLLVHDQDRVRWFRSELPWPRDTDADGLCDLDDTCSGHDDRLDLDADGVPNGCDTCETADDDDLDGVPNDCDTCDGNDDLADADGDTVPDDCDRCTGLDRTGDTDGDGTCDDPDPCPFDPEDDADGDGRCAPEDLCFGEDTTGDADLDDVCDDLDQCDGDDAAGDADADGVCDNLDLCQGVDLYGDTDSDGVCDDQDTCVGDDSRGDLDGDAVCDDLDGCSGDDTAGDRDGDGWCDNTDTCPELANPDQSTGFGPTPNVVGDFPTYVRFVVPADLDGDGDGDLAFVDTERMIWRMEHLSSGAFGPPTPGDALPVDPSDVHVADLDHDGADDLLISLPAAEAVLWYRGELLRWVELDVAPRGVSSVTTADLDGDGQLDVLVVSPDDGEVQWVSGGFGLARWIVRDRDGVRLAAAGDLDGDGDQDVLAAGDDERLFVYFNLGDGTFEEGVEIVVTDPVEELHLGDLDQDRDLDLLVADYTSRHIAVLGNQGDGSFAEPAPVFGSMTGLNLLQLVDLDQDLRLDVLMGRSVAPDEGPPSRWYPNLGGRFGLPSTIGAESGLAAIFPIDVDLDGALDVLSVGVYGRIVWYRSVLPYADVDADGVCDPSDTCPGADDRLDTDGDGVPNGCDTCAAEPDADRDGVGDDCDVCTLGDDTLDADDDGQPDPCDLCLGSNTSGDVDGDGVCAEDTDGTRLDCADLDPAVHPGATEIEGDSLDQDCDGQDTRALKAFYETQCGCQIGGGHDGWIGLLLLGAVCRRADRRAAGAPRA